jgi:hypothetical protein
MNRARQGKAGAGQKRKIGAAIRIAHGPVADKVYIRLLRLVGKVEAGGIIAEMRP